MQVCHARLRANIRMNCSESEEGENRSTLILAIEPECLKLAFRYSPFFACHLGNPLIFTGLKQVFNLVRLFGGPECLEVCLTEAYRSGELFQNARGSHKSSFYNIGRSAAPVSTIFFG